MGTAKGMLRILELSQINFRNLKVKKIDFSQHESGHLRVLGKVGDGKTNLMEIFKMATENSPDIRDKNINPNSKEKAQFEVRFSDNFFIGMTKTVSGDINFSLYCKDANEKKVTPLDKQGNKIPVGEYKKALTTELTYNIDKFLSDNPTTQFDFVKKVYEIELIKLGLIGDETNPNTFNYKLKEAISKRDLIQRKQSNLGAYKVNLKEEYDMTCPSFIDIDTLIEKKQEIEKNILAIKEEIIAYNTKTQNQIAQKKLEAEKEYSNKKSEIDVQINNVSTVINTANQNISQTYSLALEKLKNDITQKNTAIDVYLNSLENQREALKVYLIFYQKLKAYKIEIPEKYNEIDLLLTSFQADIVDKINKPIKKDYEVEKLNIVKGEIVPTDYEGLSAYVKSKSEAEFRALPFYDDIILLLNHYEAKINLQKNYNDIINAEVETTETAQISWKESDYENIENPDFTIDVQNRFYSEIKELKNTIKSISDAEISNAIWERFETLKKYEEADNEVINIRSQIKKAYASISTGVDGMNLIYDELTDKVRIKYDGRCFNSNIAKEYTDLSSYSHTQKRYIATLLQLHLLQRKANPLNVIFFDELGMDKATDELFSTFAKEHGLLIITTGTGDYDASSLNDNEILIENGHLIFSDNVEDFNELELAKLAKSKDDESETTNTKVKKSKPTNKVSENINIFARGEETQSEIGNESIDNYNEAPDLDLFGNGNAIINPIENF